MSFQDGRWLQEDTEGIFNKNCAIDYPSEFPIEHALPDPFDQSSNPDYKFSFVIWALGKADAYLNES